MFTRREILKSFLGLPIALAACREDTDVISYDGEILGASNNIGHILREKRNWQFPKSVTEKLDVIVVGGGVAGLSAAWKLKQKGVTNFRLFELEKRLGGTSSSGSVSLNKTVFSKEAKNGDYSYPWGAHYLPVPFKENEALTGLLEEMGLVESKDDDGELVIKEQYLTRDPEERVFHQGRWYEGLYLHAGESTEDVQQLAKFEKLVSSWTDKKGADGKRAFSVPVENCSLDPEILKLDKISFSRWLKDNGLTSQRLLWYCDYSCRDDYGLRIEQTSAWAGLFYFCSRVPKGGEESQPYVTFPEGNGRFVNHFAESVKGSIAGGNIVVEVIPGEDATQVLCFEPETKDLKLYEAKDVIFCAPLFTAQYLIRGFRSEPTFDSTAFEHNSWFVANLFLKERPKNRFRRDFPLSWDNVLYDSQSLGYVASTHQKGIDYGPTVLTYYYPMATKDMKQGMRNLLALDWKELADICLSDLARAHPNIREITQRIDIMRWGHAMISPRTGFMFGGEREKAQKSYRNIHFAHSDLGGIAIFEEAFYYGLKAADAVRV